MDNKEITSLVTTQETKRFDALISLREEVRSKLKQAAPLMAVQYFPQTSEFMRGTILNNTEYPSLESKLNQSIIEMQVRVNRLADYHYQHETFLIEIEEIENKIEEYTAKTYDSSEDKFGIVELTPLEKKKLTLRIKKQEIKLAQKKYQFHTHQISIEHSYKEYKHWLATVEGIFGELQAEKPEIKDINDVDFDGIRVNDMKKKIERWKLHQLIGWDLTPSQAIFVNEGLNDQADQILALVQDEVKRAQLENRSISPQDALQKVMTKNQQVEMKVPAGTQLPQMETTG